MSSPTALHIFKPGRHVPLSGTPLEFSAADLAATAAAYDPAKHEAPIVVGHPALDAPAYGWVGNLAAEADGLFAGPREVDPAFAEMVGAGRYKKISASFFAPDSPSNPVPGVYYLRHVGFLGAAAPAVKGLRTPSFAADESGVVEFSGYEDATNAGLWRSLRDWFLAKFGQDDADRALPPYYVAGLEAAASRPEPEDSAVAPAAAAFASPTAPPIQEIHVTPEEKAALEAENAALKARVAETSAREKSAAAAARHAAHVSFAEPLVAAGTLLPAQKDVAVALLDHLGGQEIAVEFGEGEAKKPLAEAVKDLLAALPQQVAFGEAATRDRAGSQAAAVEFAAPQGFGVDGQAAAVHRKALAHQAQHQTDYLTAVRAVSAN